MPNLQEEKYMRSIEKLNVKLEAQLAEARAENEGMKIHLDYFTGFFAPIGISEPVEGYAKAPSHLKYSVMGLHDKLRTVEAERDATVTECMAAKSNEDILRAENADANREAVSLAMWLFDRYYADKGPQLELCDTTAGVLSQVDNMLAGLSQQHEALRQAAVEAVRSWDGTTYFMGMNERKYRTIEADKFDNLAVLAK